MSANLRLQRFKISASRAPGCTCVRAWAHVCVHVCVCACVFYLRGRVRNIASDLRASTACVRGRYCLRGQ
jgi:hypothetical protein